MKNPKKFRKRPVVIEAIRFVGSSQNDVIGFTEGQAYYDKDQVIIATLEGAMAANLGDWIIKGVNGEFYPCKNDIFEATYDEVE